MNGNKNRNSDKGVALAALAITFGGIFVLSGLIMIPIGQLNRSTVFAIVIGAAMLIWGLKKNRELKPNRPKQSGSANSVTCPVCHKEIGRYIMAGTKAAASLRQGKCPHFGASVPYRI